MPNRTKWEFQFSCEQLLAAARARSKYHHERMEYWQGEFAVALKKAKDEGLEVNEYAITGGVRADIVVNPTLKKRLDESASKIQSHRNQINEYRKYEKLFELNLSERIKLDVDDVSFFWPTGEVEVE